MRKLNFWKAPLNALTINMLQIAPQHALHCINMQKHPSARILLTADFADYTDCLFAGGYIGPPLYHK